MQDVMYEHMPTCEMQEWIEWLGEKEIANAEEEEGWDFPSRTCLKLRSQEAGHSRL